MSSEHQLVYTHDCPKCGKPVHAVKPSELEYLCWDCVYALPPPLIRLAHLSKTIEKKG